MTAGGTLVHTAQADHAQTHDDGVKRQNVVASEHAVDWKHCLAQRLKHVGKQVGAVRVAVKVDEQFGQKPR